jgi:hypothetical protein
MSGVVLEHLKTSLVDIHDVLLPIIANYVSVPNPSDKEIGHMGGMMFVDQIDCIDDAIKAGIEFGHCDFVKYLIQKKNKINPFHKEPNFMKRMGSYHNKLNSNHNWYLELSSRYGRLDIVKYVLSMGFITNSYCARYSAYKRGYLDIVLAIETDPSWSFGMLCAQKLFSRDYLTIRNRVENKKKRTYDQL